jgi:Delta14-sterol reductase (lamin-B receptor)
MDRRKSKMPEKRVARKPGRDESPPASRTRSKSPARDKSSGRNSAAIVKKGRPKKTDTPSDETSSQSSTPVEKKEVKKNTKKTPTIVLDDSGDNEEVAEINQKRSTRLSTLRKRLTPVNYKVTPTPSQEQRSVSRSVSSLTKEDSEDEVEIVEPEADLGVFSKPIAVVLLLELLVFLPIVLQFVYNGRSTIAAVVSDLKSTATYCSVQAGSFIIAFISSTILCHLIPLGRIVSLPKTETSRKFNGIISAAVIVLFLVGLELRGLDSLTAIYKNLNQFLFLNIEINLLIALLLYIRARRQSKVKKGRVIVDFSNGLEVNPTLFGKIDVKSVAYVRSITLLLVINIALLYKNVSVPVVESSSGLPIGELIKETFANFVFVLRNAEYNCAALVVSSLLVLYALDALIFEHHLAASYQLNREGCGAELLLRFATFPFLVSFLPRFLLDKKVEVNCYLSALVAVVFVAGLIIKRCSNCLKYEYRLKPTDAKFKGKIKSYCGQFSF